MSKDREKYSESNRVKKKFRDHYIKAKAVKMIETKKEKRKKKKRIYKKKKSS